MLSAHPDDPAEAAAVAGEVAQRIAAGASPSEMAVLFRTNGQSEAFEAALAERDVPYLVRGGERFFARPEVKKGIVLLRGAARSDDGSVALPDLVRDVLAGAGWSERPPAARGASREAWESLAATLEAIDAENTLMYSSDWPHWDFDVPGRIAALPFVSEHGKRNILGETARKVFSLGG